MFSREKPLLKILLGTRKLSFTPLFVSIIFAFEWFLFLDTKYNVFFFLFFLSYWILRRKANFKLIKNVPKQSNLDISIFKCMPLKFCRFLYLFLCYVSHMPKFPLFCISRILWKIIHFQFNWLIFEAIWRMLIQNLTNK